MKALARRAAVSLLLIWGVVTLTFVLVRLAPGDPAQLLISPTASAAEESQLRRDLGLDASFASQYARWLARVVRGDLGESFATREPVGTLIARSLPISIGLGAPSILITFVIGAALGLWQGSRRGTWKDRLATTLSIAVYSAPSFWLALALVALFTYGATRWGWPLALRLPAFGVERPGSTMHGLDRGWDIVRHAVLPVTVLAAVGAAGIARYARAATIDLLQAHFVRTARAKGASERRVLLHHLGRNIAPQLFVLFALTLPGIIAGSVFVESVFAWPGMGRAMLSAIGARDYPVVLGITLLYTTAVIVSNAIADVAIALVDPRRRTA